MDTSIHDTIRTLLSIAAQNLEDLADSDPRRPLYRVASGRVGRALRDLETLERLESCTIAELSNWRS